MKIFIAALLAALAAPSGPAFSQAQWPARTVSKWGPIAKAAGIEAE